MRVYFVRHGESEFNRVDKHQHPDVALSAHGMMQAEKVAERIKKITASIIISSHYKRAKQTAEAIKKMTGKPLIYSELFKEKANPQEIVGKKYDDVVAMRVKKIIKDNENDPNYHFSTEENFFDFRDRAKKAWNFLTGRKENEIIVVTHANFLMLLLAYLVHGDELTPKMFWAFMSRLRHKNTGITVFEKTESNEWKLITWNDHSHLG